MVRPRLSSTEISPYRSVTAVDEYKNIRQLQIAEEQPLAIYLDRQQLVTLMTLGQEPEFLTLGYLKHQGIIESLEEVRSVQVDWEVNAAAVTTHCPSADRLADLGAKIVTTGCGQGTIYQSVVEKLGQIRLSGHRISQSQLYALFQVLGRYNKVYQAAGAVHSCALCEGDRVIFFVEDIGRHNAVDAIGGKMWHESVSGEKKIFYTTGRLTSEMVIKTVQMGISTLISRSGVTERGLSIARQSDITLIARAQNKHFLIYHGAERICFDVTLPKKRFVANVTGQFSAVE